MLSIVDGHVVYNGKLCQQCGVCTVVCPKNAITPEFDKSTGLYSFNIDTEKCILCTKCVQLCVANVIINEEYKNYFDSLSKKTFYLGCNADKHIRRAASSGGVGKTLIVESLKSGYVDAVYSLKTKSDFPFVEGEYYTRETIPSYEIIPNSIYHSFLFCENADSIRANEKLMLIGTPCQLKALTPIVKSKCKDLVKVCIFCKQQKTLHSTKFIAKMANKKLPWNNRFAVSYRGNGWPGIVSIMGAALPYSRAAQLPFGRRLWTVPGCNICGDPYGMYANADITIMDPWSIETHNSPGETLVCIHSDIGKRLISSIDNLILKPKKYIEVEPALSIIDIWRKQQLIPYFKGTNASPFIAVVGLLEVLQRMVLQSILHLLPRMSSFCYRMLYRMPDFRNIFLKYHENKSNNAARS